MSGAELMLVQWHDEYSIGIDEIDGHHRHLLSLLDKSYLGILQQHTREEIARLLDELIEYAKYHFSAEEDFMRSNGYHNTDQHVFEHFSFIYHVLSLKKQLDNNAGQLSLDIFNFIRDWILEHILQCDAEMGKAIRQKRCDSD